MDAMAVGIQPIASIILLVQDLPILPQAPIIHMARVCSFKVMSREFKNAKS
jgi:hypothetical protein